MKIQTALNTVIRPTLELLGSRFMSAQADAMLLAIGQQESRFLYRRQIRGPARSYWQFERGGGVVGVLTHRASKPHAIRICNELGYSPESADVYDAMADNDILACAFARLLLWTDPKPLPLLSESGWDYYLRNWRPGKPKEDTWRDYRRIAVEAVR